MLRSLPFPTGLSTGFAGEEKFPPPAISPLQGPVGDAFFFEDILDMGLSSLGTWHLAKSQAHPGPSLPVQLELWLKLPCVLQVLCPCHLGDGCACSRVSISQPSAWTHLMSPGLFLGRFCGYSCQWGGPSCSVGSLQTCWHFSSPVCSLLLVTHILQLLGLQPAQVRCPCVSESVVPRL